jgi:hypothetical protein
MSWLQIVCSCITPLCWRNRHYLLPRKWILVQLVTEFPSFYGTCSFITYRLYQITPLCQLLNSFPHNTCDSNVIAYASRIPKEHCFLEVPRLLAFVLLLRTTCRWRWAWSMVEWYWQGKQKFWEIPLSEYHTVRHKSHIHRPRIEAVPLRWEAGDCELAVARLGTWHTYKWYMTR